MKLKHSQVLRSIGYDEFLLYRDDILQRYKAEKSKSKNCPVQVWHGEVAEAEFRKWLRTFLPEKLGVTKGSIVHPLLGRHYEVRVHDVIIYDRQEATIMWEKEAPSQSSEDKIRGIPAEYVYAVFEVKATFNSKHSQDAVNKLKELNAFYQKQKNSLNKEEVLRPSFFSGMVFFELLKKDQNKYSILDKTVPPEPIIGFAGGIVLSAEDDHLGCSGRIEFGIAESSQNNPKRPLFKDLDQLEFPQDREKNKIGIPPHGGSLLIAVLPDEDIIECSKHKSKTDENTCRYYYEKGYSAISATHEWPTGDQVYSVITWSKSSFSRFAFEIESRLKGSYVPGKLTRYGLLFDGKL